MKNFKKTFLYRKVYIKVKIILSYIFLCLPIKGNKIIFDNFNGKGYGCDPKYICEYLITSGMKLDLVWLTNDLNNTFPNDVRVVKYGTFHAIYELSTAKVWIDNVKTSYKPRKRKGQFYLQTWHSSLGLKKNEADSEKTLTRDYIKTAKADSKKIDLMYANNLFRADRYKNTYWYNGSVIISGTPRNSILFQTTNECIGKVYQYYDLPKNIKIVLYAPTFRKDYNLEWYKFDYLKCIENLEHKFGGKYMFLLRLHPNAAVLSKELNYGEKVINASDYPDIQELLAVSSILISDYSGCIFDFCFTLKPVFLYTPDLEQYQSQDRQFYFSIDQLPFDLCETTNDLFNCILNFNQINYIERCKSFFKYIGLKEDGCGAKKIGNIVLEHIK